MAALPKGKLPKGGQAAAQEVVKLMQATFAAIKPIDIVNAYAAEVATGKKPKPVADALWVKFGDDTAKVIAAGSDCLNRLWQGAWAAGKGDQNVTKLSAIKPQTLAALYQPFEFLQSETLNTIKPVLDTDNGGADGSVPHGVGASSPGGRAPRGRRTPAAHG
jgi:hypothetical protein